VIKDSWGEEEINEMVLLLYRAILKQRLDDFVES
jgi:hypothetical protein